jgi:hypothetical protein
MNSAILSIENGKVGSFDVYVASYNPDGTGIIIHTSQNVVIGSDGSSVLSMSLSDVFIPANRVVKLLTQYVSGGKTSNISVFLS